MFFFFQAEDGIRDGTVTGVQTCALPIYDLLGALRDAARVRVLAAPVGSAAANVDDGPAVGRPREIGDLLTVVVRVGGQGLALVVGGCRDPHVARATRVEHPRDRAARRRGDEFVWKRWAHHLLDGEAGLLRGERSGGEQSERGERENATGRSHAGRKYPGLRSSARGETRFPRLRVPGLRPGSVTVPGGSGDSIGLLFELARDVGNHFGEILVVQRRGVETTRPTCAT